MSENKTVETGASVADSMDTDVPRVNGEEVVEPIRGAIRSERTP
jgi:hypothetical protein